MHHSTSLTKSTVCTFDFQDCAQSIISSFKAMPGITGAVVWAAGPETPPDGLSQVISPSYTSVSPAIPCLSYLLSLDWKSPRKAFWSFRSGKNPTEFQLSCSLCALLYYEHCLLP